MKLVHDVKQEVGSREEARRTEKSNLDMYVRQAIERRSVIFIEEVVGG